MSKNKVKRENHAIDFLNGLQRKSGEVLVTRKGDLKTWIPVVFLPSGD